MQVDDPIKLQLTLFDRDTSKFVKARVIVDGVVTVASQNVPHLSDGTYYFESASLKFPAGAFEVRAVYSVFDNAGFTIPSDDHGAAEDIYRLSSEPPFVQTITDKIIGSLDAGIEGNVDDDDALVGVIQEN